MNSLALKFRRGLRLQVVVWWFLPTSLFLAGIAAFRRYDESDTWLVLSLALILPALYSSLTRTVYRRNRHFGAAFYSVCCLTQVISTAALAEWVWDLPILEREPSRIVAIGFLLAASLSTLIVIPYAVLPHFRQNKLRESASGSSVLETSTIGQSFRSIQTNFDEIQTSVRREMSMVNTGIQKLQDKIATQEHQLRRARKDLEGTLQQLEEYRVLAHLSHEQQATFLRLLGRQKYEEYFIGFILGIVGSVLVSLAFEILR